MPVCVALFAVCLAGLPSCAGDPIAAQGRPPCLQPSQENTDCAALYEPAFVEIFQRTLTTTCASSGVSCHGSAGRMGGLVLVDLSESYEELLGGIGGPRRVVPGDPACSELMVRLDSPGQEWSMPPGAPLDQRARCAIRRWIADGAPPPSADGGR